MGKKLQLATIEEVAVALLTKVNKEKHPIEIVRELVSLVETLPLIGVSKKKVVVEAIKLLNLDSQAEVDVLIEQFVMILKKKSKKWCR